METVLALGSNEADAAAIFAKVLGELAQHGFSAGRLSPIFRTAPVDCPEGTPDFFNAVLVGNWDADVRELLRLTQDLEVASGRPRIHARNVARPLDIDIILCGETVLNTPELIIPHPRALSREFVMAPLRAVAPELAERLQTLAQAAR